MFDPRRKAGHWKRPEKFVFVADAAEKMDGAAQDLMFWVRGGGFSGGFLGR